MAKSKGQERRESSGQRAGKSLRLRIRVVGLSGDAFGPGKAQLLEQVARTGSLSRAAAHLGMSYMKAWRLANAMNANFRLPVLERFRGGDTRGGTRLTESGKKVLAIYHRMMKRASKAAQTDWRAFSIFLRG